MERKRNYLKNIRPCQCAVFVLTPQTAHGNFLILCQMEILPKVNFLISKQNKTPNIDPKMLKYIAILRHVLSSTQTSRTL